MLTPVNLMNIGTQGFSGMTNTNTSYVITYLKFLI